MILDLDIPDSDNVQAIQNRASSFVREEVMNVLEELLDKYDIPGKVVRIEKLELDLSDLNFESKDQQFLKSAMRERFEAQLSEIITLAKRKGENPNEVLSAMQHNVQVSDISEDALRLVCYYLQKGRLPWWASHYTNVNLKNEIENLLFDKKNQLIESLRVIIANSNVQNRLLDQLDKDLLSGLVSGIAQLPEPTRPLFDQLLSKLSKNEQWLELLSEVSNDPFDFSVLLDQLENIDLKHLTNENMDNESRKILIRGIVKMNSLEEKEKRILLTELIDKHPSLASSDNLEGEQKLQDTSGLNVEDFTSEEDEDLIPIRNAGLVLLHAYLGPFFEAIDLVYDKTFINEEARHHAAYLLHHIATGSEEHPEEHELVLNKLFCGITIDDSIRPFHVFGKNELKECQDLLQSVVENWSALKNTSVQGLQEMYLKRTGSLRFESGAWVVKIDREAMDVLIDKIPWGISMLKAPWSEQMIYVEW